MLWLVILAEVANSVVKRYVQLGVLVLAAGAIYPLVYLRQNFEVTILEAYNISKGDLGQFYATLGVIFVVTYIPSGWLADRISPRKLIAFSLALTALLGVWFASVPPVDDLQKIFAGWGIATGLTFWAALIKAVAVLAKHDEQGRFFGILDGGRGLVEALLATLAVGLFAWSLETVETSQALSRVIWFYIVYLVIIAVVSILALSDEMPAGSEQQVDPGQDNIISNLQI
ncbi:MAG: MFS transporter, partial [Gammaproteobacteria bacterium]|nr:MFS transporter [Gammaproteobacteria bacterium]